MKNFVVKTVDIVFGDFDTYAEALTLWRIIVKKHPAAVVKDNSK